MSNREKILAKSGGRCWYCGLLLRDSIFCTDHLVPTSRGGNDKIENLFPSCQNCNHEKADLKLEEYRLNIIISADGAPRFTSAQLVWLQKIITVDPDSRHVFAFEKGFEK